MCPKLFKISFVIKKNDKLSVNLVKLDPDTVFFTVGSGSGVLTVGSGSEFFLRSDPDPGFLRLDTDPIFLRSDTD